MGRVRVNAFSISLDGYGAGPDQTLDSPLGRGGESLHGWFIPTRTFQRMQGNENGSTGIDEGFAAKSMEGLGAWIMGRNMFTPSRGSWTDDGWRGWWGEEPPYHVPVFVLTHHARAPIEMKGGTVFHFVTDGIESALAQARKVAGGRNIRVGGGASTIRQYLQARLIDYMHIAVSPVVIGSGEPLFTGLDLPALGYEITGYVPSEAATHVVFSKRA